MLGRTYSTQAQTSLRDLGVFVCGFIYRFRWGSAADRPLTRPRSRYFPLVRQPKGDQGRLILEACGSHKITHHSRYDSPGQVIGKSQRPLPDNTTFTRDRRPCPQRDSSKQRTAACSRRRWEDNIRKDLI
jgi:hypothetical protein